MNDRGGNRKSSNDIVGSVPSCPPAGVIKLDMETSNDLLKPHNRKARRRNRRKDKVRDTNHLNCEQTEEAFVPYNDYLNKLSSLAISDEGEGEAVLLSKMDKIKHSLVIMDEKDNSSLETSISLSIRTPIYHLKKKLLILDVNGLLADVVSHPLKGYKAELRVSRNAIFRRPFCLDFLKFCFERFEVGIWSSRKKKNIDAIVDYLLGELKHKLLFCWDLSQCTETQFTSLENKYKPLVFKKLRRIWEKHDPELPWEKGYYNESNTLLLDDSPYKALLNPAHTAIFPFSFQYQDTDDSSLGSGGDIRVYLERLAEADDIPKFVAQHPFGQRAITERSQHWSFYSRAIDSVSPGLL